MYIDMHGSDLLWDVPISKFWRSLVWGQISHDLAPIFVYVYMYQVKIKWDGKIRFLSWNGPTPQFVKVEETPMTYHVFF